MPKLSILTSSFNSEKYLNNFLKNVSDQSFQDYELCIELVTPSQKEKNIFRKSKLSKDKLNDQFVNKKISLSKAWNNSILRSQGEYLCIWNTDDIRTKNSLELMVNILDEQENINFVYGNYFIVNKYKSKKGNFIDESNRENELKKSMILGPFFMFRKNVINEINMFDEQLLSGADFDFALRLGNNFKGIHIKDNLGYFLNIGKGLSTSSGSLQEIERTVIELRYGLKPINKQLIKIAEENYNIFNLKINNQFININNFI